MIAIIQKGLPPGVEENDRQPRLYHLQINKDLIGTFTHNRIDGLAVCLRKAAECADLHEDLMMEAMMNFKLESKDE